MSFFGKAAAVAKWVFWPDFPEQRGTYVALPSGSPVKGANLGSFSASSPADAAAYAFGRGDDKCSGEPWGPIYKMGRDGRLHHVGDYQGTELESRARNESIDPDELF